jgi:hypothetical protein
MLKKSDFIYLPNGPQIFIRNLYKRRELKMEKTDFRLLPTLAVWITICMLSVIICSSSDQAYARDFSDRLEFYGFIQEGVSFNLDDPHETDEDDQYDMSMARTTFYLESFLDLDWTKLTVIGRYDLEYKTDYLGRLDDLSSADLMTEYDNFDLREWYADFNWASRYFLRLGKQQVVWGKTDLFKGLDIIHGSDYTWRHFLGETQQIRKPLIMATLEVQVPELGGNLQMILRPGWDRDKDIGNNIDLFGGRWADYGLKGINYFDGTIDVNLDHPEGDQDDPTYGVRWSGIFLDIEYSLNYLHTFNNNPVLNPSPIFGTPYHEDPTGNVADLIYPQVDLAGITLNYYIEPIDIIVRTELSYTWDQPYNYGQDYYPVIIPSLAGIIEKDSVRAMLAFDRNVDFVKWMVGAARPGILNVQIFDTYIVDYDKKDDIVPAFGGQALDEHEAILTAVLAWNYYLDKINPTLAWGTDLSHGGGFVIAMLDLVTGDHWRLHLEADMFYGNNYPSKVKNKAPFDAFDENNQFYVRLRYQF